jgi:DNA-binding MarR family transcriptional regulator
VHEGIAGLHEDHVGRLVERLRGVDAAVAAADDDDRVRYLSDQVVVSPSRVSRVADEFVGRGLLERAVSPHDGRLSLVRLTPAGREELAAMEATFADALTTHFLSVLSREEVLALGAIAHRLGAPNCGDLGPDGSAGSAG